VLSVLFDEVDESVPLLIVLDGLLRELSIVLGDVVLGDVVVDESMLGDVVLGDVVLGDVVLGEVV
jgi:hypothetical protein